MSDSFKVKKRLNIQPADAATLSENGDVLIDQTSHELKIRTNASNRTVVTTDQSQALTNKTIDGDSNTIQDVAITSLKTDAGAASTFISRDGSGIVISTKAVPTGAVVGDSDSQTLTNKTIDGDNNTISDIAITSLKTDAGAASTFISRNGSGAVISTKAVPTGTVVGTTDAQVITAKDIDGGTASNTSRITVPKDTKANLDSLTRKEATIVYASDEDKMYVDNGSLLVPVGSGSGGVRNFIENGDAELNNTNGWSTYADAAGTRPVDGTGGSPAGVTFTNSATSPLDQDRSFIFAKDASNRQGEGVAYSFAIDSAFNAKVLTISFDYRVNSGTFVAGTRTTDSDVIVYLYDVDNSLLIEPSNFKLFSNSSTISDKFEASFQTPATGANYRLILHCASTSASAYELKIDNVAVSPSNYTFGTPVTDWVSYTPTGSWTTNTTYTGQWRRVGDKLEARARIVLSGAPGGTAALTQITLPSGLVIDTAKLPGTTSTVQRIGFGAAQIVNEYPLLVYYQDTTSVRPIFYSYGGDGSGTDVVTSGVTATAPASFGSGDIVDIFFEVPIVGWSSSVQTSDRADTRVVAMRAGMAVAQNSSSVTINPVIFDDKSSSSILGDTHGMYSTATGIATIPVSGWYRITAGLVISGITSDELIYGEIQVNSSAVARVNDKITETTRRFVVSTEIQLKAGDQVKVLTTAASDTTYSIANSFGTYLNISSIQGPSAIAANETVAFKAHSATTAFGTSYATAVYPTEDYDTHSAYNSSTGVFTAPITGIYNLIASARSGSAVSASTANNGVSLTYRINSGSEIQLDAYNYPVTSVNLGWILKGSTDIRLSAGDTVEIRIIRDSPVSAVSMSGDARSAFSIRRTGS